MEKNELNEMNLYILEDVLHDYTPGMAVVAAPTLERCRELWEDAGFDQEDLDSTIAHGYYTVLQVVGQPEGVVSYVYGGG